MVPLNQPVNLGKVYSASDKVGEFNKMLPQSIIEICLIIRL